jgi:predicted secreted protein
MSYVGREFEVKKNNTVIAGVRTRGFSWSGEAVDITTGEDNGKRTLDDLTGQETLTITCDGVTKGDVLRSAALGSGGKKLTDITFEGPIPSGGASGMEISGDFVLTSYEETGAQNDAYTFSVTFESSGAWTYTAAA